ncbi:hypothetical protein [Hyalangium rubrum]|uniref:Lipoprotein n=1 Tax=Hyalangium rubrum TaxID=3103134 RepID=A0ABU5HA79_9BACT|nr:hypothetical protein [Hyalangium sp. s54d21]MDY7230017.1 hypothetical protein [Hyalangium sp. s54d21]
MRRLLGACAVVAVVATWACGDSSPEPTPPAGNIDEPGLPEDPNAKPTLPDSGTTNPPRDGGTTPPPDGGTTPPPDGGTTPPPDGGTDGGTQPPPQAGPGPWPNEAVINYSQRYNLGRVRSVGVDDAYNIWLLDGERIGVLRPGTTQPHWVSNIGQARYGFGADQLALGSTVICGGSAGRAYVGYSTYDLQPDPEFPELHPNYIVGPGECFVWDSSKPAECYPYSERRWQEFQKGDMDAVKLDDASGSIVLEEHLGKSVRFGYKDVGIRNSNNWHYDEDRSVLTCKKVMRGEFRGEVYIGTNHGVSRIRGLEYNSHRHPVWDVDGSLRIGYNYAVGIAQNGDLLIGNEWKIGLMTPPAALVDYDDHDKVPYKLNTYVEALNDLPTMDKWRGFEQTVDGLYYLGSAQYGLWEMTLELRTDGKYKPTYKKVPGPTELETITTLAATDDGSLFVGTPSGLWRLDARKELTRVSEVGGSRVRELLYDPTVKPGMLYVLTDAGLTVIRGH